MLRYVMLRYVMSRRCLLSAGNAFSTAWFIFSVSVFRVVMVKWLLESMRVQLFTWSILPICYRYRFLSIFGLYNVKCLSPDSHLGMSQLLCLLWTLAQMFRLSFEKRKDLTWSEAQNSWNQISDEKNKKIHWKDNVTIMKWYQKLNAGLKWAYKKVNEVNLKEF